MANTSKAPTEAAKRALAAGLRYLDPDAFRHLDVAQLVEHAFGLARVFKGRRVVLLYLIWEPTNALDDAVFRQHRDEISRFSDLVDGSFPEFQAQEYQAMWSDWMLGGCPAWLEAHVSSLRTGSALVVGGSRPWLIGAVRRSWDFADSLETARSTEQPPRGLLRHSRGAAASRRESQDIRALPRREAWRAAVQR